MSATRARWPTRYWGKEAGQRLTRHATGRPVAPATDARSRWRRSTRASSSRWAWRSSPSRPADTRSRTRPGRASCGHLVSANEQAVITSPSPRGTRIPLVPAGASRSDARYSMATSVTDTVGMLRRPAGARSPSRRAASSAGVARTTPSQAFPLSFSPSGPHSMGRTALGSNRTPASFNNVTTRSTRTCIPPLGARNTGPDLPLPLPLLAAGLGGGGGVAEGQHQAAPAAGRGQQLRGGGRCAQLLGPPGVDAADQRVDQPGRHL